MIPSRIRDKRVVAVRAMLLGASMWMLTPPAGAEHGGMAVEYSTFLGGNSGDLARDVAFDAQGNIYVTGGTASADFPATVGAYQMRFAGNVDTFLTKLSPTGQLIWSTYIGGPNYDRAYAVEVDHQGNVYVAGRGGRGFPTTSGVLQPTFGGDTSNIQGYGEMDGAISKFDSSGRLLWSTYVGADDGGYFRDIAVDSAGNVYGALTRCEHDNPHVTAGAFETTRPKGFFGVILKISPDGRRVVWGSYLGSTSHTGWEVSTPTIRVDGEGNVIVAGGTDGDGMPVTPGAYQRRNAGGYDWHIAKFRPDGSGLVFATYLGGSSVDGSETHALGLDASGNIVIGLMTQSLDYPTTASAFDRSYNGTGGSGTGQRSNYPGDGAVSILSADGSRLIASSYLGGRYGEGIEGVEVDGQGNIYVSGATYSDDFPVTPDAPQRTLGGSSDLFVAKFSANLAQLLYATYLGGSGGDFGRCLAVSNQGIAAVAGSTGSTDWPTHNAFQPIMGGGGGDAAVARIGLVTSFFSDSFETGDWSAWAP